MVKKASNPIFMTKAIKVQLRAQEEILFTSFMSRNACFKAIEDRRAALASQNLVRVDSLLNGDM